MSTERDQEKDTRIDPLGNKNVEPLSKSPMMSRRKVLGALGMATAALMVGGSGHAFAATTETDHLKLKKTSPVDIDDVNFNFDRIDEEFTSRAVSPDFYKIGTAMDDTACVQAAFDSGKPVIFTRDYYVKSVRMFGIDQQIDFNGYWLWGISSSTDTAAERDCVLEIAGLYLQLFNIKVISDFNPNYRCGVHWRSESTFRPAEHIKIYGLQINRFLIGLQFGSYLDDPNPLDAPQSENYIFGIHFRSVQNCIILNQPNGFLKIIGGLIDCSPYEWNSQNPNPYSHENAYCFYNKDNNNLVIDSCAILKVASQEGYCFKGSRFILTNCTFEIGSNWGYMEGDAQINFTDGGFQGATNKGLFEIAPGSAGRLNLNGFFAKRAEGIGVGGTSTAHLIDGLNNAPNYSVSIDNSIFREWAEYRIASTHRESVYVRNTRFSYTDSSAASYVRIVNDQDDYTNLALNVDTTGEYMSTASNTNKKSGWTMYVYTGTGTVYFRKNTTDIPAGFRSCIEVKATSGISYVYSSPFQVVPGSSLVFRGWAKYTTAGAEQKIVVVWVDISGTVLGVETMILPSEIHSTKWTQIIRNVTVPTNAVSCYMQTIVHAGSMLFTGLELYAKRESIHSPSLLNQMNQALNSAGEGVILTSPNGTRYKITISDTGVLTSMAFT